MIEILIAQGLIVGVGGLLMLLIHIRFKQLDKKFGR